MKRALVGCIILKDPFDCGGITSKELLASIHEIARSEINVVGCDLVEVAPIYDPSEQTANTASKLIREMLLDGTASIFDVMPNLCAVSTKDCSPRNKCVFTAKILSDKAMA